MVRMSNVLKELLEKVLEGEKSSKQELKELVKIVAFTDVRLELIRTLHFMIKEKNQDQRTEECLANTLQVVEVVLNSVNEETEPSFNDPNSPLATASPEANYAEFKKLFTQLWFEIMKWENKSKLIHKKILILLPEKVMKHLTRPLHMSDYLLSAFDLGGPLSLMALQGIFVLMTTYNFEISDFYTRLYSMFTPAIFHAKYRARFFAYASDFLRSTHLPEYLVGAFVKRLSRLALSAQAHCLPLIFDFIHNLFVQHPGVQKMIKREGGPAVYDRDPYDHDEPDPQKSHGIDSMLFEFEALQNHYIPEIANRAKFIQKPIGKLEKDLDETLYYSWDDVFQSTLKEKTPLKFMEPYVKPNPIPPLYPNFPTSFDEMDHFEIS